MSKPTLPLTYGTVSISGSIWLASDMHLSAHSPKTNHRFLQELEDASHKADAIILVGDIFDVWIGDDNAIQKPEKWLQDICWAFKRAAKKTNLYIMRGNRDFLLGDQFATHTSSTLLPDQVILKTQLGNVLVSHGDEYCTSDHSYQRFKSITRKKWLQNIFLQLSLTLRKKIAAWARKGSMHSQNKKSQYIMDVEQQAINQAFEQSGCNLMVHGHTHRPNTHIINIDGTTYKRIVLTDWDYDHDNRGGWLIINKNGIRTS